MAAEDTRGGVLEERAGPCVRVAGEGMLRGGASGVVRIAIEVYDEESPIMVSARAASIRRAEDIVRSRYPGSEVRVVFTDDGGLEEVEGLGPAASGVR